VGDSHESLHSAIAACRAIIDGCIRLRLAPMFPRIAESEENLCDSVDVRTVNVLRLFNHEGTLLPIVSGR